MQYAVCFSSVLFLVSSALASDVWPQFRGPSGDGHAEGSNFPDTWSESKNIAWKTALPGRGWSSPVVADGVAWMTFATALSVSDVEKERIRSERLADSKIAEQMNIVGPVSMFAIGVDVESGKPAEPIPLIDVEQPDPIHSLNSFASPSPIIHKGNLICHFGRYGTVCLDINSRKIRWKKAFEVNHSVGPGSSPVLYDGVLVIPCDGTDTQFIVGLDVETGKQLWRANRPALTGDIGELHKAFATPLVVRHKGKTQVIAPSAQWFTSYDPRTGREHWRYRHGDGFSNVPVPVVKDGVAYLCTGFIRPELHAVRIDGSGNVTDSAELWRWDRQVPTMSSPIIVGDEIYFVADVGVLTCLNSYDGKQLWQKRFKGNFISSPLYADGKIYFFNREGETTVIHPGRQFDEVAVNLLSGEFLASPIGVGNALLVRSDAHLYKIQND